ncbi:MAG: hypothetical protein H0W84_12125 [Bacteroidetes bacterium]|nr:hypothetical protein [Bacteroidota bacterium]
MENKTKNKRIRIALAIILIINISNMMRSETLRDIRGVDALQLIACGMLMGALIVNFLMGSRNNKE